MYVYVYIYIYICIISFEESGSIAASKDQNVRGGARFRMDYVELHSIVCRRCYTSSRMWYGVFRKVKCAL